MSDLQAIRKEMHMVPAACHACSGLGGDTGGQGSGSR